MNKEHISRRQSLQLMAGAAVLPVVSKLPATVPASAPKARRLYTYCLNMSTIHGQNLGFMKELEAAAAAGFRSVEIWMDTLQQYLQNGGTIAEVKKRLGDLGLKVEDCISFNEWIVDDAQRREKGIDGMKKDMSLLAELGCHRMAATGKGTTATDVPDKDVIADRYHTILEIGAGFGIVPQLEMWGFQRNLQDVADVIYIAMKSRHASARVLLDVFHLYRGNTSIETLNLIAPDAVEMFHMNDIPPGYDWHTIADADRIYPGDGIAPIKQTLAVLLKDRTTPLVLSTELFNKAYYKLDALTVAKTSLAKMKTIVEGL
jgi:sugar phosphate isomerase/epimerase